MKRGEVVAGSKTALVTGASKGIGRCYAIQLAELGYNVVMVSLAEASLEKTAQEVAEVNSKVWVRHYAKDLATITAAEELFAWTEQESIKVDVLINNAGLAIGVDKEHEGNLDEWETMIDTNIKALLSMTRLVVPGMIDRGRGHIINIGSIAGDAAYPGGSVYCATKAAVKALSDGLRIDLVDTPLRVTNVKPGLVETNFSVVRFRGDQDKADNVYKGIQALSGDDIAEVVYFAASAPEHMQIAEVLVMPTNQATGTIVSRCY